ncbi:MAG: serine/threonine protein kinase [Deltaproteobacteria bacterium]|nr:serine/threonine protein kinase [Deltaproteobacteria bacterium]
MSVQEEHREEVFPRKYAKYELLARMGEGGMAEVFKARLAGAQGFEKIVVIKRILPHLANNKRFVSMFVNEAKLAARIHHQAVVQVFELGQTESGELYMAMELVDGVDLRKLLVSAAERGIRLPVWFSVQVVKEMLGGLSYAHELAGTGGEPLHVVHRDVTPSNVFISRQGEVKLADFGIAKAAGSFSEETQAGELKGKTSYMPPEQLHGLKLDGRADVFSTGVVLWELLCQRRLFGGRPDFDTMLAITEGSRDPPSMYNPAVPLELDAIVLQSLEPNRDHRIPTARTFQAMLLEVLPRIRQTLLPSDVVHVVDVVLGKKEPDPVLGADVRGSETRMPLLGPIPSFDSSSGTHASRFAETRAASARPHQADLSTGTTTPGRFHSELPTAPSGAVPRVPDPRPISLPEAVLEDLGGSDSLSFDQFDDPATEIGGRDRGGAHPISVSSEELESISRPNRRSSVPASLPSEPAPYGGAHPFFVKFKDGTTRGPVSYVDALRLADGAYGRVSHVSHDGQRWTELAAFVDLAGLDVLLPEPTKVNRVTMVGTLGAQSLIRIFGKLARSRATGRLVIMETGADKPSRRELDILKGAPTFLYTDRIDLQLPGFLAEQGLLRGLDPAEVVHQALENKRRIEDCIPPRPGGMAVKMPRAAMMKARVAELFYWRQGKYAFDAGTLPRSAKPFSSSLLTILYDGARDGYDEEEIVSLLDGYMQVEFQAVKKFDEEIAPLELGASEVMAAHRLSGGWRLTDLLKANPSMKKQLLSLALVLLELELLRAA